MELAYLTLHNVAYEYARYMHGEFSSICSKRILSLYKQTHNDISVHFICSNMKAFPIFFLFFAVGSSLDLTAERNKCVIGKIPRTKSGQERF